MNQLDTDRLHRDLRDIVDDVEEVLKSMANTTGEQVDELKSRASRRLHKVNSHLAALEHSALDRGRAAGRHARDYARSHPWIVIGGVATLAIALGALLRVRN